MVRHANLFSQPVVLFDRNAIGDLVFRPRSEHCAQKEVISRGDRRWSFWPSLLISFGWHIHWRRAVFYRRGRHLNGLDQRVKRQ